MPLSECCSECKDLLNSIIKVSVSEILILNLKRENSKGTYSLEKYRSLKVLRNTEVYRNRCKEIPTLTTFISCLKSEIK